MIDARYIEAVTHRGKGYKVLGRKLNSYTLAHWCALEMIGSPYKAGCHCLNTTPSDLMKAVGILSVKPKFLRNYITPDMAYRGASDWSVRKFNKWIKLLDKKIVFAYHDTMLRAFFKDHYSPPIYCQSVDTKGNEPKVPIPQWIKVQVQTKLHLTNEQAWSYELSQSQWDMDTLYEMESGKSRIESEQDREANNWLKNQEATNPKWQEARAAADKMKADFEARKARGETRPGEEWDDAPMIRQQADTQQGEFNF